MMNFLKIRYICDDDGIIRGAVATDPVSGYETEYVSPAYGGLWVDGRQTIGHCDFALTGQNGNRRRKLRAMALDDYEKFIERWGV